MRLSRGCKVPVWSFWLGRGLIEALWGGGRIKPLECCLAQTGGAPKYDEAVYGEHLLSKVLNNFATGSRYTPHLPPQRLQVLGRGGMKAPAVPLPAEASGVSMDS